MSEYGDYWRGEWEKAEERARNNVTEITDEMVARAAIRWVQGADENSTETFGETVRAMLDAALNTPPKLKESA